MSLRAYIAVLDMHLNLNSETTRSINFCLQQLALIANS